ncbi:hypothetical protein, partial [Dyella mobilis]|uniref:hypothetical protein n=1 Tax=Dyella mobilis TaxID=1849582 RepID=UPI0024E073D9
AEDDKLNAYRRQPKRYLYLTPSIYIILIIQTLRTMFNSSLGVGKYILYFLKKSKNSDIMAT